MKICKCTHIHIYAVYNIMEYTLWNSLGFLFVCIIPTTNSLLFKNIYMYHFFPHPITLTILCQFNCCSSLLHVYCCRGLWHRCWHSSSWEGFFGAFVLRPGRSSLSSVLKKGAAMSFVSRGVYREDM